MSAWGDTVGAAINSALNALSGGDEDSSLECWKATANALEPHVETAGGGGATSITFTASNTLSNGEVFQDTAGRYWRSRWHSGSQLTWEIDANGKLHKEPSWTVNQRWHSSYREAPHIWTRINRDWLPGDGRTLQIDAVGTIDEDLTDDPTNGHARIILALLGNYQGSDANPTKAWVGVWLERAGNTPDYNVEGWKNLNGTETMFAQQAVTAANLNAGVGIRLKWDSSGHLAAEYKLSGGSWTAITDEGDDEATCIGFEAHALAVIMATNDSLQPDPPPNSEGNMWMEDLTIQVVET